MATYMEGLDPPPPPPPPLLPYTPIPTLGDDKTWSPAPLLFHSILPPSSQELVEGMGGGSFFSP